MKAPETKRYEMSGRESMSDRERIRDLENRIVELERKLTEALGNLRGEIRDSARDTHDRIKGRGEYDPEA
jgi:hypothetical protein